MSMRLEYCKLGEVIHITSGKECPPENKTENSSIPIRGATGVIGYSKKPLYERPIILVGRVGAGLLSGMSGILNRAENPCWPSDNTLVIIPKEDDDFDYIEYCLRYSEIYPYVSGSSQPLLTQTALKLLEIPWPSRETRHIIANNGRQIDQLLLMNKKIMNISQEIIFALFRSWFIDFDPVKAKVEGNLPYGMDEETAAHFPNSFEASELGPIPTGWRVGAISEFGKIVTGRTPSSKNPEHFDGPIPFITIPDLARNIWQEETERTISQAGAKALKSAVIPANSVCVSCIATVGNVGITTRSSITNQQIHSIVCDKGYPSQFVYSLMTSFVPNLKLFAGGGAVVQNISKSMFGKQRVIIPPIQIVKQFTELVERLYQNINVLNSTSRSLISTRDTLLPRMMSGELSVS